MKVEYGAEQIGCWFRQTARGPTNLHAIPGRAPLIGAAVMAALALGGCSTTRVPSEPLNPLDRPATDLGLLQSTAPALLLHAQANPYAPLERCVKIRAEIAQLDEVLGPDVDRPPPETSPGDTASAIASDLIGGFIPYRSIVRRLSGAAERQEDLERAVTAGVARRGFLRGLARAKRCPTKATVQAVQP